MTATVSEADAAMLAQCWRVKPHTYARFASGGRWTMFPHMRHIGETLFDAITNPRGRVILNCPPRHGKSELTSFWTPLWFLDVWPERGVILASYASDLATDFGRRVRNEMQSNDLCLSKLRDDSKSASRWNTPEGGGMVAVGVGGPLSGRGGDLILIDDPIKNWQEAHSAVYRHNLIEWFNSTLYTRQEPGASIVVIMTRWHEDDLTGYLVEHHEDDWTVITLPAIALKDDMMGRAEGEPLCSDRFPLRELEQTRKAVGSAVWHAMYQQQPESGRAGRVYRNYSTLNIDDTVALADPLPLHFSADFGAADHIQSVIGQYSERADGFVAYDQISGDDTDVRCSRDLGDAFVAWAKSRGGWKWPELHLFGDATGGHPGRNTATGISDWSVLQRTIQHGLPDVQIRRRVPKMGPPVADRVNAFNEVLRDVEGNVRYLVSPRCERLLRDFKEVKKDDAGLLDKSNKTLTHASDAEGYRVNYLRPTWRSAGRMFSGSGKFNV